MPENSSPDGQPGLDWLLKHADDSGNRARLYELLATEMHNIAAHLIAVHVAKRKAADPMPPTALVLEAWGALFRGQTRSWEDRDHLLRSVTVAMLAVLAVRSSKKKRWRQRDDPEHRSRAEGVQSSGRRGPDLVAFDAALRTLAMEHPRMARYVELRFFDGRTNDEASRVLSISSRSGARMWSFARAWLQHRMAP